MMIERLAGSRSLRIVAGLAVLGPLALVDLLSGLMTKQPLILLSLQLALFTVGLWVPAYPRSRLLPGLSLLVAGLSVAVTFGMVVAPAKARFDASWGLAEAAGLLMAAFVLARGARPPLSYYALGAVALAVAVEPLRYGPYSGPTIIGLIQLIAFGVVATVGGYLRFFAATKERQLVTVRAEQRAEFARDLHDFVAHHVTGIVVQAQGALFVVDQDPPRVRVMLEQIEQAGTETMSAMRRMVGMLRDASGDAPLAPLGRIADVGALVDRFTANGGPQARLSVEGSLAQLPVEVDTSAYRVVLEALTNVRQHASAATMVDVSIRCAADWLTVRILNDGPVQRRAITAPDRTGFGLVGLRERVGRLGGWLRAGPGIGGGWLVDVALPLTVAL